MKRSTIAVSYLPERIEALQEIATNLSWSWNRDARALFGLLDRPLWHLTRHNPLEQLRRGRRGSRPKGHDQAHPDRMKDQVGAVPAS